MSTILQVAESRGINCREAMPLYICYIRDIQERVGSLGVRLSHLYPHFYGNRSCNYRSEPAGTAEIYDGYFAKHYCKINKIIDGDGAHFADLAAGNQWNASICIAPEFIIKK